MSLFMKNAPLGSIYLLNLFSWFF